MMMKLWAWALSWWWSQGSIRPGRLPVQSRSQPATRIGLPGKYQETRACRKNDKDSAKGRKTKSSSKWWKGRLSIHKEEKEEKEERKKKIKKGEWKPLTVMLIWQQRPYWEIPKNFLRRCYYFAKEKKKRCGMTFYNNNNDNDNFLTANGLLDGNCWILRR